MVNSLQGFGGHFADALLCGIMPTDEAIDVILVISDVRETKTISHK